MTPTHLGAYPVIRELARGGQGIVFLAQHPQLKHQVAIKLLTDLEPESLKRFKQEARILAKIRHPNLLQVTDFGMAGQYPFIVMEYINGWNFKGYLAQTQPTLERILEIISVIAGALAYMHQHGLVHRDLKPDNILVEKENLRPVLADLGIVKRDPQKLSLGSVESKLSVTGEIMGTPAFMAPEQVDAGMGEVGPWTDVYGLGATLFQLLTGQPLYKGAALSIYSTLVSDTPPPRASSINPDIPGYIDEAIFAATQKRPDNRPQTMEEWATMLRPPASKKHKKSKLVPVRRDRRWAPILFGTLGMGGLVAYFLSLGATPKEAKDLAKQELRDPGSIIVTTPPPTTVSPPTPQPPRVNTPIAAIESLQNARATRPPEELARIEARVDKALQSGMARHYDEGLEEINSVISEYPNIDVPYYVRAVIYMKEAMEYGSQNRNDLAKNSYQKALDDMNIYLRMVSSAEDPELVNKVRGYKTEVERRLEILNRGNRRHHRYSRNPHRTKRRCYRHRHY